MPRTMTPRGTASNGENLSRNHLEGGLSKKFLELVDKLTDEHEREHWLGPGHSHEYIREDASLPRRWKRT